MLRCTRLLSRYQVLKQTNGTDGKPLPNMELFYLADDTGRKLSFWNDIPFQLRGDSVNVCIEVPKEKSNKYEVIKTLPHHPFMQDTKKNVFSKEQELRYYAKFPLFNYGFIPRTWEQTLTKDSNGLFGDDDPIDVCELSLTPKAVGAVFRAKVLGCFCLIDQGELDWKVLAIDAAEAERENINGIWDIPEQHIAAIKEWFKTIKIFDGKKPNSIAFQEQTMSRDATLRIIHDTHLEWKKLISSSDPVYDPIRQKFHLQGYSVQEHDSQ